MDLLQTSVHAWERLLIAGTFLAIRLSSIVAFAPPFNSAAIPTRIKAGFVMAMVFLLTPVASSLSTSALDINIGSLLGELSVGIVFGITLMLLNETLLFAGSLLSMNFSFSLANLMDPNSRVETPVLGTLISWLGTLVLLGSGLHRVLIAAVMRSIAVVPLGMAAMRISAARNIIEMVGGIFLAGIQLAAPVIAAAITVEIAVSLMARLTPALPSQVLSVPIKSLVSYIVLIGSLAIWPRWIDGHFASLLQAAQRMVTE